MSLLAAVPAAGMAFGRLINILMDQQLVDDTGESQGERVFVMHTSALTPQIAKLKARTFTLGLRPKRRIMKIEIGKIEEGIILKKYLMTITTQLFKKRKDEETEEEPEEIKESEEDYGVY